MAETGEGMKKRGGDFTTTDMPPNSVGLLEAKVSARLEEEMIFSIAVRADALSEE